MASNDALDALLKEMFPAGETKKNEDEQKVRPGERVFNAPHPTDPSVDVQIVITETEALHAARSGGRGVRALVERKYKEALLAMGYVVAELTVTASGIHIHRGEEKMDFSPMEAVALHQALGDILRAQMARAQMNILRDILGG